jgi:hypothetical protein
MVQFISDKSSNRAIYFREEDDGTRRFRTIAPHFLALALLPVGMEDGIDLWSKDVMD